MSGGTAPTNPHAPWAQLGIEHQNSIFPHTFKNRPPPLLPSTQIEACDGLLAGMEALLGGFQADLGQVSEQIRTLQVRKETAWQQTEKSHSERCMGLLAAVGGWLER